MTIAELIKSLQEYPSSDKVVTLDGFGYPKEPELKRPGHDYWRNYEQGSTILLK